MSAVFPHEQGEREGAEQARCNVIKCAGRRKRGREGRLERIFFSSAATAAHG